MLRLFSKDREHSNAILYGGELSVSLLASETYKGDGQIYFVESDYGNHMRLTWEEIAKRYTIAGCINYDQWRHERQRLIDGGSPYIKKDIHYQDIVNMMQGHS